MATATHPPTSKAGPMSEGQYNGEGSIFQKGMNEVRKKWK